MDDLFFPRPLVLAKVVLVLEHASLGAWVRARPAWVDVVLLIEKAFEGRHEFGGFGASLSALFQHVDVKHVWLNTICLSGALLSYNMLSVVRKRLGKSEFTELCS